MLLVSSRCTLDRDGRHVAIKTIRSASHYSRAAMAEDKLLGMDNSE